MKNIEITNIDLQENASVYNTIIEINPTKLLSFESCITKENDFITQQVSIDSKETLEGYISALRKTYAAIHEDLNQFDATLEDEFVFGVDERKNIIIGQVIEYEKHRNKVLIRLAYFNSLQNKVRNIIEIDPKRLINIKDKSSLIKLQKQREEELQLKIFFNHLDENINNIQDDLLLAYSELDELEHKSRMFSTSRNGIKRIRRKKKYLTKLISQKENLLHTLNIEKNEILLDQDFKELFSYAISL